MAQTNPRWRAQRTTINNRNGREQLRRVGRAIIALAQAQLEADAEAEHQAATKDTPAQPVAGDDDERPR